MDRFTFSGRRGEYCATCFNVLFVDPGLADAVRYISVLGEANVLGSKHAPKAWEEYSLVRNPLKGSVIVETKVTGVNDVVGAGLLRKLVKRLQVACFMGPINIVSLFAKDNIARK